VLDGRIVGFPVGSYLGNRRCLQNLTQHSAAVIGRAFACAVDLALFLIVLREKIILGGGLSSVSGIFPVV